MVPQIVKSQTCSRTLHSAEVRSALRILAFVSRA
jgi:hypothetical protein